MNEEILSRLEEMGACKPSFNHAASFQSFDTGWQESGNGILMIGTLHFLKICEKRKQILAIIKEARGVFFDQTKYNFHSESSNLNVIAFVDGFLAFTPKDCQGFLDKAYAVVKKLVYVYYPIELDRYAPKIHVPMNNLVLANIVRKYIPSIDDAFILQHSE